MLLSERVSGRRSAHAGATAGYKLLLGNCMSFPTTNPGTTVDKSRGKLTNSSFISNLWQTVRACCARALQAPDGFRLINNANELSADELRGLESLAFEHGTNFLSYTIIEADRSWLILDAAGSGKIRGAVGFLRQGRYLHLTATPVCSPELREQMHAGLVELARLNKLVLCIAWLPRDEANFYEERGWDTVSLGQDCRISLSGCTWSGSEYSWLRRQESYCSRQGLKFKEIIPSELSTAAWDELRDELRFIDRMHLAGKTFNEQLRGWEGRPLEGDFARRRLFVAVDGAAGRIVAYLCCNPCRGGTAWAFEMYRSRPEAPRGAIAYLMLQTQRLLQKEGVSEVDLCPVPAIIREVDKNPAHRTMHLVMWAWRKFGNMYFDVHDIYHFRSRFRPQFKECYRVAWPRATPGLIVSFILVTQMWRINIVNLALSLWSLLTHRKKLVELPKSTHEVVPAPHFAVAGRKTMPAETSEKPTKTIA